MDLTFIIIKISAEEYLLRIEGVEGGDENIGEMEEQIE